MTDLDHDREYFENRGFAAYKIFLALKLHFKEGKYDFFKYEGQISAKRSTFDKRNDKYFFCKLAKDKNDGEIVQFLVPQFLEHGPNVWIGNLVGEEGKQAYLRWAKRLESLGYRFTSELEAVFEKLHEKGRPPERIFLPFNNDPTSFPMIIRLFFWGDVSLETIIILDMLTGFINEMENNLKDGEIDIWRTWRARIDAYKPFLTIDTDRHEQALKKLLKRFRIQD